MIDDIEPDEERLLTAEYVLGLLSADEEAAFEQVMAVDPELRQEYAFWADRLVALTEDIPEQTPPASVLAALKADLFDDRPATVSDKGRSFLSRLGLLPAMVGGVVAALAVLWVINLYVPNGGAPGNGTVLSAPQLQARIAAEDESLVVMASYDEDTQALRIDRTVGQAPDGRVLELWLIADDNPPVSLGVLPDTNVVSVQVDPALVPALPGGVLAISEEPPGGAPDGSPTGAILAVGNVTQA